MSSLRDMEELSEYDWEHKPSQPGRPRHTSKKKRGDSTQFRHPSRKKGQARIQDYSLTTEEHPKPRRRRGKRGRRGKRSKDSVKPESEEMTQLQSTQAPLPPKDKSSPKQKKVSRPFRLFDYLQHREQILRSCGEFMDSQRKNRPPVIERLPNGGKILRYWRYPRRPTTSPGYSCGGTSGGKGFLQGDH